MATEVTYDPGLNIFNHDKSRGKWPSSSDFLYACIGHAFRVDAVVILPSLVFEELGFYGIIPYFILLGICVVPVVFIQSFIGQFSSTGFISVFRISPVFKGIGYVGLLVNLTVLTFLSVYGAIPLFYLFHTFRPTLPWSCEGAVEWSELIGNHISPCTEYNTTVWAAIMHIPSLEFFRQHLREIPDGAYSVWLALCTSIIWVVVGAVLIQPMETIAKFLRYTCISMLVILSVCVVRLAFLPGAISNAIDTLIDARGMDNWMEAWMYMPLIMVSVLGPGWGNILTMASFNNFKGDTLKTSWHLCLAQSGVMCGLGLMALFVMGFLRYINPGQIHFHYKDSQWKEFLFTPTVLSFMELPRFWTSIFFTMMLLGALNLLAVQLLSVLTSLFDEFEILRTKKRKVTLTFIGALALCSIPFCSKSGFNASELVSVYLMFTQVLLNLLLLVVVLWVFGRKRLQRDITFMTDVVCATWKVLTMTFVTPIFYLVAMFSACMMSVITAIFDPTPLFNAIAVTLTCCLLIPGYCVFTICRVGQCNRSMQPVDWYPADPGDRQKYDEHLHGVPSALTPMTAAAAE